jgi:hypothetical protein
MVWRWLASVLDSQREWLAPRHGVGVMVVGLANARDEFVYGEDGLVLASRSPHRMVG